MDLGEMVAQVDDLEKIKKALIREQAIRETMAESGETREIVEEMVGALEAMQSEAVLDLTDGEPTTLRAALIRYVHGLDGLPDSEEEVPITQVVSDLDALLAYPWRDEEATLATHDINESLRLNIFEQDDEIHHIQIGGMTVASVNYDEHGWAGMEATEAAARAVHRAVLARTIGDRDHHIQLSSTDRRSLMAWLERPSGSWRPDGKPRITVDAVEGGRVLVRTRPYQWQATPESRG